jgi:hypothetical protein
VVEEDPPSHLLPFPAHPGDPMPLAEGSELHDGASAKTRTFAGAAATTVSDQSDIVAQRMGPLWVT